VPREIFGGVRRPLHVDGISVYEFDRDSGNITQHRIEQLLINNKPVHPEEGVIAALHEQHTMTVPSFARSSSANQVAEFQTNGPANPLLALQMQGNQQPTSLFAMEASESSSASSSAEGASDSGGGFDWDALERKNKSRKKFGLKPLSREEFLKLEAEVQLMAQQQQQQKLTNQASSAAEMNGEKGEGNFFEKLFGNVFKDTCESNFDCERPEICCDFGFKKMCCASGTPVGADGYYQRQYATVPVPVSIEDPPGNFQRGRYY